MKVKAYSNVLLHTCSPLHTGVVRLVERRLLFFLLAKAKIAGEDFIKSIVYYLVEKNTTSPHVLVSFIFRFLSCSEHCFFSYFDLFALLQ